MSKILLNVQKELLEVKQKEIEILRDYLSDIANEPDGTGFNIRGHAQEALDLSESLSEEESKNDRAVQKLKCIREIK